MWSSPFLWIPAVVAVVALGAESATSTTTSPASLTASADQFSEQRAMPIVAELSESIGARVPGTAAHQRAADALSRRLRAIPGVSVEQHEVRSTYVGPHSPEGPMVYRVVNVVARIEGRRAEAVLLSAHFDTPPESVGAADDALGVAAVVEVARALASGPQLERSVVLNLSGNEELCLCGALGFLEHRWSKDVVAFVNLEATGLRGRAVLFQAGPSAGRLLDAYAHVARPYGTVLGQDLFEHGLVPAGTDGYIYREAGVPGLDLALFEDGYAIHSALDRIDRLEPGSLQHMGESALASARALANAPVDAVDSERWVYYDLFGHLFVHYPTSVGRLLAALAVALTLGSIAMGVRRGWLSLAVLARCMATILCAMLGGLLLPVALSLIPGLVLSHPHGWYATPWLARLGYGVWALIGCLLAHAAFRRWGRGHAGDELTTWRLSAAGAAVWCSLLVAAESAGLATSFLALWWSAGSGLGLAIALWLPARLRPAALILCWIPGMVVTLPMARSLLDLFIPISGRLPSVVPLDPLIGALAALPVVMAAVTGLAVIAFFPRLTRPTLALTAIGLAFLAALAIQPPYVEHRPKRLHVAYHERRADAELKVSAADHLDAQMALAGFADAGSIASAMVGPRRVYSVKATAASLPEPRIEIVQDDFDSSRAERTVVVHVEPGSNSVYRMNLSIPNGVVGWSVAGGPHQPVSADRQLMIQLMSPPTPGVDLSLRVEGRAEVSLEIEQRLVESPAVLLDALSRFPSWTTSKVTVSTFSALRI